MFTEFKARLKKINEDPDLTEEQKKKLKAKVIEEMKEAFPIRESKFVPRPRKEKG